MKNIDQNKEINYVNPPMFVRQFDIIVLFVAVSLLMLFVFIASLGYILLLCK